MAYKFTPKEGQAVKQQELIPEIRYTCPGCRTEVVHQPMEQISRLEITCGTCGYVMIVEKEEPAVKQAAAKKTKRGYRKNWTKKLPKTVMASLVHLNHLYKRMQENYQVVKRHMDIELGPLYKDSHLQELINWNNRGEGEGEENQYIIQDEYVKLMATKLKLRNERKAKGYQK